MIETEASCGVLIAVREKPIRDIGNVCGSIINYHATNTNTLLVEGRPFAFDIVLKPDVSQQQVYEDLVLPLVKRMFQGFNCTALAYGQTGTGKSYSMGLNSVCFEGDNVGIVPRCFEELFQLVSVNKENKEQPTERHTIFASYIEIYNEKVYDLLADNSAERVAHKGFKFTGGVRKELCNIEEAIAILAKGNKNRHVRPTVMNSQSSRSHAVFSIHVRVESTDSTVAGCLNLVDLAGSEGVRRTGHQGIAMSEGVHINQGLLTIGKVLHAMAMGYKVIPYRDSVLSSVLQESLSPSSYLTLLACISPHREDLSETLSTLRFAQNAKQLKYTPQINTIVAKIKEKKVRTPCKLNAPQCKNTVPALSTPYKYILPVQTSMLGSTKKNHRSTFTTPSKIRKTMCSKFNKTEIGITSNAKIKTQIVTNGLRVSNGVTVNKLDSVRDSMFESDTVDSQTSVFSLNISSSTTVDAHRTINPVSCSSSYSPIVRKCMNEFEKIVDNKMAKIMESIQSVHSVAATPAHTFPATMREELKSIVKDLFVEQRVVSADYKGEAENSTTETSICQLFATSSPKFIVRDALTGNRIEKTNVLIAEGYNSICDESHTFLTDTCEQTIRRGVLRRTLRNTSKKLNDSILNKHSITVEPCRRSQRLSIKAPNDQKRRSIRLATAVKSELSTGKVDRPNRRIKAPLLQPKNGLIATYLNISSCSLPKLNKTKCHSQHKKAILNMINNASMKELQLLPQIGQKTAYQLVTQRILNGKFKTLAAVEKAPIWRGKAWERFAKANMLL